MLIHDLCQDSMHSVPVCTFLPAIIHYTHLWNKAWSWRHSDNQLCPFFLLIFLFTVPLLHCKIIHRNKPEHLNQDVPATCSRHNSICLVLIFLKHPDSECLCKQSKSRWSTYSQSKCEPHQTMSQKSFLICPCFNWDWTRCPPEVLSIL